MAINFLSGAARHLNHLTREGADQPTSGTLESHDACMFISIGDSEFPQKFQGFDENAA